MRRTLVSILPLVCLLNRSELGAQVGAMRVAPPSPVAASLGKFGDIPVSLYSGIPDIAIPLFTAKGRTLDLPIVLRYHASGIKVEEIGGWVGMGWTLEAGGVITRTVRGIVDENTSGYYNTGNTFWYSTNWPTPTAALLDNIRTELADGEPDEFFFDFAGRSGQFVLGPTSTSNTIKEYRAIPAQQLQIVPTLSGASIVSWVITTEDGVQYTFGAAETSTDYTLGVNLTFGNHYGQSYTSSWHLTQIRSPGGDAINLTYTPYSVRHRLGTSREQFDYVTHAGTAPCVPSVVDINNEYGIDARRLTSITTAAHTITFTAGTDLRADALSPTGAPQEPRLDKITVSTAGGTVIRQFQLTQDYSTGRLTLVSVAERDPSGASLPPYSFTYATPTLPAYTSNAVDSWGYYNGQTTNTSLIPPFNSGDTALAGANRNPNLAYAIAGTLTQITYPTGGSNSFVFESNDYGSDASGSLPLADGPPHQVSITNAQGTGQFTVGGVQAALVTIHVSQSPSSCTGQLNPPCPYAELVGYGKIHEGNYYYNLAPGTYTINASANGNSNGFASIEADWSDRVQVEIKTGGGLRIAEVDAIDGMGNTTVRKYKYTLQSDAAKSSGVVNAEPRFAYTYSSPNCSYISRTSMSRLPVGTGLPVGYREVMVWSGPNGEYGKRLHTFRSVLDVADQPSILWPFLTRTSYEWKRGQALMATDYNASGQTQRSVSSTYSFRDEGTPEPTTTRRFRGMSIEFFSAGGAQGSAGQGAGVTFYNPFEVISAWSYMDSETETTYDQTGANSFSATKSFVYGNPSHMQLTQVTETNSDGTQRITNMKYPADYASGSANVEAAALTGMVAANMHTPVVEHWVTKRIGTIDTVVQASLQTYKTFAANQFLPYQSSVLRASSLPGTGVTDFSPSSVTNGLFVSDSRYLLQETANTYDVYGRITQLSNSRMPPQVTKYQYGGNPPNNAFLTQITRVVDGTTANDLVSTFNYDGNGYVSSIQDEGGSLQYFLYDSFGRLRQIKNNAGTPVRAYGYTYSRTSPNWAFNASSPNAIVDTTFLQSTPTFAISTQYIDGLGRPIQSVEQDASYYHVTATQYDAMGRVWRAWRPYTWQTSGSGYDPNPTSTATSFYNTYLSTTTAVPYTEILYTTDPLSRVSQVTPDHIGTLVGSPTRTTYNVSAASKQQYGSVSDELSHTTSTYTDVFGYTVKSVLGSGASTTTFGNDIIGHRIRVTDPQGLNATYSVSMRGVLQSKTTPDAGTVNYRFDQVGNLRFTQDANAAVGGKVAFTNYDIVGRPLNAGYGAADFWTLDPFSVNSFETNQGNWLIVRQYDSKPTTTSFPWSLFGSVIPAVSLSNIHGRLAAMASKSNGQWQAVFFSYDGDGSVATRYVYTQINGGLASAILNYTRDLRGAPTQTFLNSFGSFYQWYDYDNRGLLWKVFASTGSTKPTTPNLTTTYRASGQPQNYQFQGGPLVPIRYTIRDQIAMIGDTASFTYPFSAFYSYNPNRTVLESQFYNAGSPATKRYKYVQSYDNLDRLMMASYFSYSGTTWTQSPAYQVSNLTYDQAGNLRSLWRYKDNGQLIDRLTYAYPSTSNRLSSVTDVAPVSPETWDAETGPFTYDANGNVLTASAPYSITSATYDPGNLPLTITRGGTTTSYRYDANGQRIAKQVGAGNTELYLRDDATTLGVFTISPVNQVISVYYNILAGQRVEGRYDGSAWKYYHADLLGSTRSVVQGTTVLESYDYDPWGLLMPGRTLGSGTKEKFSAKEQDAESGLEYFGARYYMPALGRWASVDPLGQKHPQWSPYNYVLDNPEALVDPDGRQVRATQGFGISTIPWQDRQPPPGEEKVQIPWQEIATMGIYNNMYVGYVFLGHIIEFISPIHPKTLGFDMDHPTRQVPTGERVVAQAQSTLNWLPFGAGENLGRAAGENVLAKANFAQKTVGAVFSQEGRFAGKTVAEVAEAIKTGQLAVADVPVQYIVRDGNSLILNTRSAQALERAGVPRSQWAAVDMTGDADAEARLTEQLKKNGLTSAGTPVVTPN
jgi:RHS repeat-associated protein